MMCHFVVTEGTVTRFVGDYITGVFSNYELESYVDWDSLLFFRYRKNVSRWMMRRRKLQVESTGTDHSLSYFNFDRQKKKTDTF